MVVFLFVCSCVCVFLIEILNEQKAVRRVMCVSNWHAEFNRLEYILKHRYPEGAIGVDSPSNPCTKVHADTRRDRQKAEVRYWVTENNNRAKLHVC